MKSEYVRKYREMDRDCALLSRYQTQEGAWIDTSRADTGSSSCPP